MRSKGKQMDKVPARYLYDPGDVSWGTSQCGPLDPALGAGFSVGKSSREARSLALSCADQAQEHHRARAEI